MSVPKSTVFGCLVLGMALSASLILLGDVSVHTRVQPVVIVLSVPQLVASAFLAELILGPHVFDRLLFNSLAVFSGGVFYGALLLLGAFVFRRVRRIRGRSH